MTVESVTRLCGEPRARGHRARERQLERARAVAANEVGELAAGDDAAVVDERDVGAQLLDLLQVVRRVDDCGAVVGSTR